jgi:hypothetical protein
LQDKIKNITVMKMAIVRIILVRVFFMFIL